MSRQELNLRAAAKHIEIRRPKAKANKYAWITYLACGIAVTNAAWGAVFAYRSYSNHKAVETAIVESAAKFQHRLGGSNTHTPDRRFGPSLFLETPKPCAMTFAFGYENDPGCYPIRIRD